MKNTFLILISLFSLFLVSCGVVTYSTFTSKDGWSIEYPKDWTIGTETAMGILFTNKDSQAIIVASRQDRTDTTKSDADLISLYKKQRTIDTSGTVAFKNAWGSYVEYTNMVGKRKILHKEAWSGKDKYLYTVACTLQEKNIDAMKKVCETMIQSVTIP